MRYGLWFLFFHFVMLMVFVVWLGLFLCGVGGISWRALGVSSFFLSSSFSFFLFFSLSLSLYLCSLLSRYSTTPLTT
ncbi:hypothetical protein BJX66DRAFT_307052 [Aspergillus keveii]|uniref:Uncharacterized protein n=1 Tax=Aspergillus keveii TaxID=714993 RepID=A0ABR4G2F9_9EURO